MTRRWLVNGFALAVLWLFVRGVDVYRDPARLPQEFLIGLIVGLPVAFALRRFYATELPLTRSLQIAPYGGLYLLVFLKDLVQANVTVARIVLSPSLPINPSVVEIPLRVRTDAAITTIANSITLTPGTLTMDYDRETNSLYVHSIAASNEDAVVQPVRRWEDYALVIFDEELKPGDPVPRNRPGGDAEETVAADGGRPTGADTRLSSSTTAQPAEGGERDGR